MAVLDRNKRKTKAKEAMEGLPLKKEKMKMRTLMFPNSQWDILKQYFESLHISTGSGIRMVLEKWMREEGLK